MSTPPVADIQLYRRLLTHVLPYKWVFVIAIGGMLVVAAGDAAIVAMLKPIVDQGLVERNPVFIQWMPIALFALAVMRAFGNFVDGYCMTWVARHVIQDLRQLMFDRLLYTPVSYYDQQSSGALAARLIYDVEQVAGASTSAFRAMFLDATKTIFLLSWMFYISWQLSLMFVIIIPIAFLIFKVSSNRYREISIRIQKSIGMIMHIAKEALQGHRVVKIFSAYKHQRSLFFSANNYHRQQVMKGTIIMATSVPLMVLLSGAAMSCIIWVALQQALTPGVLSSYIGAMLMLSGPVKSLASISLTIQGGLAGAQSIFGIMDLKQETDSGSVELKQMNGHVRFEKVSFRYLDDTLPVLKSLNLDIKAGTTVALVGVSGSGKSTIASLLLRFYTPRSGRISIDGVPLNSLTLKSLRAHTALVTQEIMLFDDTIANNIMYGKTGEIDQHRLKIAADAANVSEFADALPLGLDTLVGEQGLRLSGGQRQRIAIARALYKNAPLLIMDEATSSLDSHSERYIQDAITRLVKDRTSLIIAHRLSTIENADLILVLEAGQVVERGKHRALLQRDGVYAKLHAAQHRQGDDES